MKKNKIKNCFGFTLMELLVVVSVFGIILVTVSTIIINSFRARNRTYIIQDLEANGNLILNKVKYNLVNGIPETIVCPGIGIGSSITFVNKIGVGDSTVLSCVEGDRVASSSAVAPDNNYRLSSEKVVVTGCGNFVTCNFDSNNRVQSVDFSFTLQSGDVEAYNQGDLSAAVARNFSSSVVVRR